MADSEDTVEKYCSYIVNSDGNRVLTCKICGQTLSRKQRMKTHLEKMHKKGNILSDQCMDDFFNSDCIWYFISVESLN